MSQTIEQKVVEMRFDNSNFEKNVSKSMSTLNDLKKTIDDTSSATAFSGLSKAIDRLDFSGVSMAVQSVTDKFNLWEEVAIGAARRIGESITNLVTGALNKIPNWFKGDVAAGWSKFEEKTNAVQTIMSSIADEDWGNVDKLEYVNELMDNLNWYTDETSYNLTDMISNIGKFTAAGVDLDVATSSMMGIANWAAVSGQNAQAASRAMYNLSQALGTGAVQLIDWKSIENANMATKEFKELTISVAEARGALAKGAVTYATFRDSLKDKWFTADILNEVLGQYSGFTEVINRMYNAFDDAGVAITTSDLIPMLSEARKEAKRTGKSLEEVIKEQSKIKNLDLDLTITDKNGKVIGNLADKLTDLGERAFKAAQEYRTWRDAVDATKDAVSTAWLNIYQSIVGGLEDAKKTWTRFGTWLYELWVEPISELSTVVREWSESVDENGVNVRELFIGAGPEFEQETGALFVVLDSFKQFLDDIRASWETVFPPATVDQLIKLTKRFRDFTIRISMTEERSEKLRKKLVRFFKLVKNVTAAINKIVGAFSSFRDIVDRVKAIVEVAKDSFNTTFGHGSVISTIDGTIQNIVKAVEGFVRSFRTNQGVFNLADSIFERLGKVANDASIAFEDLSDRFDKIVKGGFFSNLGSYLSGDFTNGILGVIDNIIDVIEKMQIFTRIEKFVVNSFASIKEGFTSTFEKRQVSVFSEALQWMKDAFTQFIDGFRIGQETFDKLKTIWSGFASLLNILKRAFEAFMQPFYSAVEGGLFTRIGKFLSDTVLNALLSIPEFIAKIISKIDEFTRNNQGVLNVMKGLGTIFQSIVKFILDAVSALGKFFSESTVMKDIGDKVFGFFSRLREESKTSTAFTTIRDKFYAFVNFFREDFTFDNFLKKLKEIKERIANFTGLSDVLNAVSNAFKKLFKEGGFVSNLFQSIRKFFFGSDVEKVKTEAISNATSFATGIKNIFSKIFDFIKGLFDKDKGGIFSGIGEWFKKTFGGKDLKFSLDTAKTSVKKFVEKVRDSLKNVWSVISDLFSGNSSPITAGIKEAFSNASETFNNSGFKEGFKSLMAAVGKIFNSIFGGKTDDSMDSVESQTSTFGSKVKKVVEAIVSAVITAVKAIKKAFEKIKELWTNFNVGNRLKDIFGAIGDFFSKKLFGGNDDLDKPAKEASPFRDKLVGIFEKVWNAIKTGFEKAWEVFKFIKDLFVGLINGIKSIWDGIKGFFTENETGKQIWQGIKDFFNGIVENVIKPIGDWFKNNKSELDGLPKSSETDSAFNTLIDSLAMLMSKVVEIVTIFVPLLATGIGAAGLGKLADIISWPLEAIGDWITYTKNAIGRYVNIQVIKATGEAIASILKALGQFVLEISGAIAILTFVDSINPGKIGSIMESLGLLVGITLSLMAILFKMAGDMTSSSSMYKLDKTGFSSSFSRVGTTITAMGKVITELGVAIGVMVASMAGLVLASNGDVEVMWNAVGAIGALMAVVVAIMVVLKKLEDASDKNDPTGIKGAAKNIGKTFANSAAAMLGIAAAIGKLAKVAIKIAKQDPESMQNAVYIILELSLALVAISAILSFSKNQNIGSAGKAFLAAAGAIAILALVAVKLAELQKQDVDVKGVLGALLGIGSILAGMVFIIGIASKNEHMFSAGLALIMAAASIAVIASVMQTMVDAVAYLNENQLLAVGGMLVAMASVISIMALIGGISAEEFGAGNLLAAAVGMIAIALAMKILTDALTSFAIIASEDSDIAVTAAIALGALVVAFALMGAIAALTGTAMLAFGAGILLTGVGFFALAAGLASFVTTLGLLAASAGTIGVVILAVFEGFLDALLALEPKLVDALTMIFRVLNKVITNSIREIASTIGNVAIKILEVINQNIDKILTLLGPILDKLLVFIKPYVDGFIDWLLEKLDYIINGDKGLLVVIDNAINGPNGIIAMIEAAIPKLLDLIKMIISDDGGLLYIVSQAIQGENGILTIIHAALFNDGGVLWMIRNLLVGDNGILTIIHDALFADGGILPMVRDLVVGENGVLTIVKDALIGDDGILGIVKGLLTGENGILTIIDDAINGESGILNIIDKAINGEDGILAIAGDAISGICELIKGSATDVVDAVKSVIKTISDGLTNPQDGIIATLFEGVTTAINLVASRIVALAGTIFTAVVDVINGLAEQIETNAPLFWSAIKRLAKAIWDSLFGIIADKEGEFSFFKLGKAAIDGFIEGITSFIGGVNEAAMQVPDAVKIGIESGLAIQSPSKVMHQYGMYTVQGFANGIKDNVHIVDDSASSMSKGMIETIADTLLDSDELNGVETGLTNNLSDILSGVTDSLSSDIMNPVITPVLDLSELETGTKQMSGMLDMNNDYAIGTAITGASYNPYEYYDGTEKVDDVQLRAESMAKLEQKLDEAMARFGRAKVVLDTGAMVGELRDPMDLQLGRKAALIGRGTIPAVTIPTNL